ncbi:hypothetical protein ACSSS7_000415 [Eimeria intestinalis]
MANTRGAAFPPKRGGRRRAGGTTGVLKHTSHPRGATGYRRCGIASFRNRKPSRGRGIIGINERCACCGPTCMVGAAHPEVLESEVYSDLRNVGACYWHGRDRKMRPLLVISLQRLQQLQREAGAEEKVTRLLIFCLEFFLRYLCVGGVVENWCILCDLDGTSFVSFPLPLLLKLIQLIQGAYRGRLYRFYILHAPRLFHFVARPLLASLPSSTAKKIRVYTQLDDWHQERRTQFADHQVEKKYGGMAPDITENWYPFHFFPGPFEPAAFSAPNGEGEKIAVRWKSERSLHAKVHPSVHMGVSLHTSLLWRRPIKSDRGGESACADKPQTLRYAAWLHHLPELHLNPKTIRWARVSLREDLMHHHQHLLQHLQIEQEEGAKREAHVSHQSVDNVVDHGACSNSFHCQPRENVAKSEDQDPPCPAVSESVTAETADAPLSPAVALAPPRAPPSTGEDSHLSLPVECAPGCGFNSGVSTHFSECSSSSSTSPASPKELQQSPLPIACASVEPSAPTWLNSSSDRAADEEQPERDLGLHAAVNKLSSSQRTSSKDSPAFIWWESPVAHRMEYCSTGPGEESRVASLQDLKIASSVEPLEHSQLIPEPPLKAFLAQGKARVKGKKDFAKVVDSSDSWWPSGGQAFSPQLSSRDQQQRRLSALRRLESPLHQQHQQQEQQLLLVHAGGGGPYAADEGSRFFGIAGRPTAGHLLAYRAMKRLIPPLSVAAADTPAAAATAVRSPIAALLQLDAEDAGRTTRGGGSMTYAMDHYWSLRDAETTGHDARQPRTMPRVGSGSQSEPREVNLMKHAVLRRRLGSQLLIHRSNRTCADDDIFPSRENATSSNASSSATSCMQFDEAKREVPASHPSTSEGGFWGRRVVAPVAPQGSRRGLFCHQGKEGSRVGALSTVASNLRVQVRPSADSNTSEKRAEGRVAGLGATEQQSFTNACVSRNSPGRRTANKILPLLFFAGLLMPAAAAAAAVLVGAGAEGPPSLHSRTLIFQPSGCLIPYASGLPSTNCRPEGRKRSKSFAFTTFLPFSFSLSCRDVERYALSSASLVVPQPQPAAVFVSSRAKSNAMCSSSFPWWYLTTSRGGNADAEQQLLPHASAAGFGALCMRRAVRVAAVKPKSRGSIDKRFKVTATGKLMYRRPGLQHNASTKTAARRTRLRRAASLRPSQITRLLGPLSLHP